MKKPVRSRGCASCLMHRRAFPRRPAGRDREANRAPDRCVPSDFVQTFALPLLLLLSLPVETKQKVDDKNKNRTHTHTLTTRHDMRRTHTILRDFGRELEFARLGETGELCGIATRRDLDVTTADSWAELEPCCCNVRNSISSARPDIPRTLCAEYLSVCLSFSLLLFQFCCFCCCRCSQALDFSPNFVCLCMSV